MATQLISKPKNSSLSKFQNIIASKSFTPVAELPALPIATFATTANVPSLDTQALQAAFETELNTVKASLLKAQRSATLARSQSLSSTQAQSMNQEAQNSYDAALASLKKLVSISNRLGGESRRKARMIEGAAEWRQVRHSIARNLQVALAA
ncbi:MAG TPA: hypothetical protein VJR29_11095 [bacterium]|nr:hypothetical protein [bacterium]